MNFHNKSRPDQSPTEALFAYQPAPRDTHTRASVTGRAMARAGAPILGSRLVFPRRFDAAVAALLDDPHAVDISPEHATRYFGTLLHLDIDPTRLVDRIGDYVIGGRGTRWMGESFLDAADWSAVLSPIAKSPIHREMCDLVAAGPDFRKTRAYRHLVRGIELGRPSTRNGVRIASTEAIDAYFGYCLDLIKSARKRGVLRHRVAGGFHRLRMKHRFARSMTIDSAERDIGVAIDADGRIVRHLGGKHRTAIAQALKLPWLPVEVRLVHVRWIAGHMQRTGLPAHQAVKHGLAEIRAADDERG
jgi:hypothetical protein